MLAGEREKGEARVLHPARPDDLGAVLAGSEAVFLLARNLAALAAGTALQIDQQRQPAAVLRLRGAHPFTMRRDATR